MAWWVGGIVGLSLCGIVAALCLQRLQRKMWRTLRDTILDLRRDDLSRLQDRVSMLDGQLAGLRFALSEDIGRLRKKLEALERREHSHPLGVGSLAQGIGPDR